jgi:Zn-dependent protease
MSFQYRKMEIAFLIIVLIVSIIAHEVAHGYAANALGDPTARLAGRLTLNPIPHIDLMGSIVIPLLLVLSQAGILFGWAKPVPYNPFNLKNQRWGEAIVASAGSLTNIFLAVLFALVARGLAGTFPAAAELAALIAFVNLFLGFLNLIPFPPLDGFTVLRGILPYNLSSGLRAFEAKVQSLGAIGLILTLLLLIFVFLTPFSIFISWVFGLLVGL